PARAGDRRGAHRRAAHHAALPPPPTPHLELRLHEREDGGARPYHARHYGEHGSERDEGDVDGRQIGGLRQHGRRESTRVRALDHEHARILPELPRELPVADVERDHPPRATLEQAVGEAARRGAHVERYQVTRLEAEGIERTGELLAAPAHV